MISVKVQFSEYGFADLHSGGGIITTVNHAMFYVADSENNTIHRVHSSPGPENRYKVDIELIDHYAPRDAVGEGFEVQLTPAAKGMSGTEIATMLAKLKPPAPGEGACQWWILKNIARMEASGKVYPNTVKFLLSDSRINSSRLMEFQELRNQLQAKHDFSGLVKTADLIKVSEISLNSECEIIQHESTSGILAMEIEEDGDLDDDEEISDFIIDY